MSRNLAGLLLLWLLCATAATAQPGSDSSPSVSSLPAMEGDWLYRTRPDDSLSGIADRLLAPQYSAGDLRRHNGLSHVSLSSGDTLRIPMQWLNQKPEPARVTSVKGDAWVERHLQPGRQPLSSGMTLNVGDSTYTGQGQVKLTLADGSTLRIGRESTLTLNRLTQFGRTGMADTRMRLDRGRIRTRVKPVEDSKSRFEVETPSAVAAVRGTAFELQVDSSGTHLAVTEGQVLFGTPGKEQIIPAGHSAWQKPGRALRSQPLPSAPALAGGPESVRDLPITFTWQSDHSRPHRVNLINEQTGEWLISQTVTGKELALDNLANGQYRLELAALAPQGLQGQAASHTFSVDQAPPPVVLPGSRVIHVNTLGDRVTLFWQTVDGAQDYQLQLASDARFQNIVQDRRLKETRASLELEQGNRYHVRIRPHSDEAAKSHWGPAHSISLE